MPFSETLEALRERLAQTRSLFEVAYWTFLCRLDGAQDMDDLEYAEAKFELALMGMFESEDVFAAEPEGSEL